MAITPTRRTVVAGIAGLTAMPAFAMKPTARVVVVGGGFGGATAARFLKQVSPSCNVTLVEPNATYVSCPFSNLVIGGTRNLTEQEFGYAAIEKAGIAVVHDVAQDIDSVARTVTLGGGAVLPYDRLILSPGIDLKWGALPGYDQAAADVMPHAWKAGKQTTLLRRQLEAMDDGGVVAMAVPASPYRCPPGPYERASLIAHYLKTHKPRSKLLVLDAKESFSKQPLFEAEWADRYGDLLEWRAASNDGLVTRVDPTAMVLETDFETIEATVANVIPPQQAGEIARRAGVADATGWCPINATSFESTLQPGIHVIGDATIAAPMPKSAFSANLQAKVCAIQVARMLAEKPPEPSVLVNTCYSYVSPDAAISIVGAYTNDNGVFANVPGAGGISAHEPGPGSRAREAAQAVDWFQAITTETFG